VSRLRLLPRCALEAASDVDRSALKLGVARRRFTVLSGHPSRPGGARPFGVYGPGDFRYSSAILPSPPWRSDGLEHHA
jgi:hypothetical protein